MGLRFVALLLSGLLILGTGVTLAKRIVAEPQYVGSKGCSVCHRKSAQDWAGSHHAWAWKTANKKSVLGDFNNATIDYNGIKTRFIKKGDRFIVETDGPDGKILQFDVKATAGLEPLQQYLLETETGRLQALDLAWDGVKQRWYHLYPDQSLKAGDGLHWTGPYKTWNARCAECHATGYKKNYDVRKRRYSSTQAEIGVGCEACHGPGQAHLAWAKNPEAFDSKKWQGLTDNGLTIGFNTMAAETEIQQCASCHARREPLADGNPVPGTKFHDAYRLALLRPGLYHADGSIQDEVYVYGSFLQSKMYARGVRCTDCHDAHSAKLKADGNAVCGKCHSLAGNSRFPSLSKSEYDDPSHHFHSPGSAGAQCKSCHMIERLYMGIDGRRDHSFRIPRPDVSIETGAPNACNDCHVQRDASWAAKQIAQRFPSSTRRKQHFSQVFAKARKDITSSADALVRTASDESLAGIVRATALNMLTGIATTQRAASTARFIVDADPLVRAAAIELQRGATPQDRVLRLLPALEDKLRSVRIAAARVLLGAPVVRLPARNRSALQAAQRAWRLSLLAKTDFPETHIVLGGIALVLRNPRAAEQAFREAVRQDPQLVQAWRMIVRIRAAIGDRAGAREAIDAALRLNPNSPVLRSIYEGLQ